MWPSTFWVRILGFKPYYLWWPKQHSNCFIYLVLVSFCYYSFLYIFLPSISPSFFLCLLLSFPSSVIAFCPPPTILIFISFVYSQRQLYSCVLWYSNPLFSSCRQPRERFSVLYMLYREEAVALALHIFYKLLLLYSNLLRWFEVKRPAIGGLGSSETRDRDPESVLHGGNKKERLVWNSGRWPEQVVIGDLNCGVLWEARRHSSWPLWGDHAARINK